MKRNISDYVTTEEDENGHLRHVSFKNTERFNFAFDIVDAIAHRSPEKLAMLHVSDHMTERRFTFKDMSEDSNRCVNYLRSLGVGRGDKVMLILKRHYQFWPVVLACHKLGAVVIPATNQLMVHDLTYRFKAGDVKAVFCTADGTTAGQVDEAEKELGVSLVKVIVNGKREGWRPYDSEIHGYSSVYVRPSDAPGGNDPMLMFFTSGTTSYPKMALHSYKYALGHYVTAKYWHLVEPDGLHFTISSTRTDGACRPASTARSSSAFRNRRCGVSAAPDPVRGQVVKATIRLVKGTKPTDELKKDVQNYVKTHTAPYKYPRIVVFREDLPKTVSGKIQRNKL